MLSATFRLLLLLIVFRILNSLLVVTYFDPDEYWQSLEVAHLSVFGYGFKTWEWGTAALRSFLHPALFALLYHMLKITKLDLPIVIALGPRVLQAVFAGVGDFAFYKFSLNYFKGDPKSAAWTLVCNLTCWFMLYCLPRTYSNSMETILLMMFMSLWPWSSGSAELSPAELRHRRIALVLAAIAVVIRPTSIILWILIGSTHLFSIPSISGKARLILDVVWVGTIVLVAALCVDYLFYGRWVFTLWNFVEFNVLHDAASLYGVHPWHWYFTNAIPSIFGPFIVPLAIGLVTSKRTTLANVALGYVLLFSFNPHKEFRFILPIVPLVMPYIGGFFGWAYGALDTPRLRKFYQPFAVFVTILLLINGGMVVYFSAVHQRGTVDVMWHLQGLPRSEMKGVLFLMPCHSTPFYSHIHKRLDMRILDCQPNLARPSEVDEAAQFYLNPDAFIDTNITKNFPSHVVMFDVLVPRVQRALSALGFRQDTSFFHCHFPSGSRVGKEVVVWKRKMK